MNVMNPDPECNLDEHRAETQKRKTTHFVSAGNRWSAAPRADRHNYDRRRENEKGDQSESSMLFENSQEHEQISEGYTEPRHPSRITFP